jgi:hypothetical protein
MPVAVIYKTGTIPAGQSLSSAIDCTAGAPIMVFMPMEWTDARLTFQVSYDGTNWRDVFDRNAQEVAVNIRPGTAVRMTSEWTESALGGWIRIRSGSRVTPMPQAADRVFMLMINTTA